MIPSALHCAKLILMQDCEQDVQTASLGASRFSSLSAFTLPEEADLLQLVSLLPCPLASGSILPMRNPSWTASSFIPWDQRTQNSPDATRTKLPH